MLPDSLSSVSGKNSVRIKVSGKRYTPSSIEDGIYNDYFIFNLKNDFNDSSKMNY